MSDNDKGAREFWLEVGPVHPGIHLASTKEFKNASSIHVIEFSAYESLRGERDKFEVYQAKWLELRHLASRDEKEIDALKAEVARLQQRIFKERQLANEFTDKEERDR